MGSDAEGKICIPLEDFWDFVEKYSPIKGLEIRYGVPIFNRNSGEMQIDYAAGTESPEDWAVPPKAITQWKDR